MSSLSLVETKLPPGFRFHPKDEELICDYLMHKVACSDQYPLMIEVDLNRCEPWDIPANAYLGGKQWYFYSQRDRKYATGLRTNRATTTGYWKATGKDNPVTRRGTLVGMRKTLVFYQGRAPKGSKTEWVMHEFRIEGPLGPPKTSSLKDWVLCRMFYKNKAIPNKQGFEDTNSSSLLQVMDPYNHITPDHQTQAQYEQVPCFSNFNPTNFPNITHINPTKSFPNTFETSSSMSSLLNPSMSCDKNFINNFLNHFAKVESNDSTSFGEGSPESFLSDVGCLPNNAWNNY